MGRGAREGGTRGHPREGEEGELEEGERGEEFAGEEECPRGEQAEEQQRRDVGALMDEGAEGEKHQGQPEGNGEGEPGDGDGVVAKRMGRRGTEHRIFNHG